MFPLEPQPPNGPHTSTPAPPPLPAHSSVTHPEPVNCTGHSTDPAATACVTNEAAPQAVGPALLEMDQHPLSPLWDLLGQVSRFLYGKCGKPQLAPGRSRSTPGGSTRRRALLPPPSADHPEDSWSSFKAQLKRLCFEALTPQAALGASCANTAFRPHTNVKPGREPASVVLAPKTRSNPRQTPNKHMLPQIPAPVQASLPLSPASA